MSYQLSIWLDDKTAKDLEALSRFEERKRGAMVRVLIRRAAKQLTLKNPSSIAIIQAENPKPSEGEDYVAG